MYRVVATTKNVTDIKVKGDSGVIDNEANAILIENAKKLNVPAQAYEVTLALPSGFAINGAKLSIKHTKGSSVEYYTGTVSEASSSSEDLKPIFVTFTTNGFSPFVIYAASANVASIGDGANQKVYPTLQAAVDAVQNGETINVTGTDLSATVSGSKTFKVTGQTVNLTAAPGYSLTNSGDTYTVSHQSSGGPGSSGGSISAPTTYAVNVNAATNGAVAADKKTASKGTTIPLARRHVRKLGSAGHSGGLLQPIQHGDDHGAVHRPVGGKRRGRSAGHETLLRLRHPRLAVGRGPEDHQRQRRRHPGPHRHRHPRPGRADLHEPAE